MAEIIFHNKNLSKIDTLGQNFAETVIQIIVKNRSTASLVHRNDVFIANMIDGRKYIYKAVKLTEILRNNVNS